MAQVVQKSGQQTLLLDLGLPRGDSLALLGLESSFHFGDALRHLRRLDATLTDKLEAQLNFLSKPEGADFKTGPAFKDPTLPLDIAMGLRKNDAELRALKKSQEAA